MTGNDVVRQIGIDAATEPFDLLGALPTGTTVLEASAGTGKTYAIVGLALRYVAEHDLRLDDLLLVTFSRAATQELRDRTRTMFAQAAAALGDPATARTHPDALIAQLAATDDDGVRTRRARLLRALSEFDAATIATTHSFCQRMLDALGFEGDRDPDAVMVEDVPEIVAETIEDEYLASFARADTDVLSVTEARRVAKDAVFHHTATLEPVDADGIPAARRAFALRVRDEVDRRKRLGRLRDFDDLLTLLHRVLTDATHGGDACARIRQRYRVVLVDEFQDTDPQQWDILRETFHGHATLVLVGDPKQAIYAFRGAEVLSYLGAVDVAGRRCELTTNWRTDSDLVAALDHLYGGAALGDDRIVVHPVSAQHPRRLDGAPVLRVRYAGRRGAGPRNKLNFPSAGRQRDRIAADVGADIARVLTSRMRVGDPAAPVRPGDIAVLVRTHDQVSRVHSALVDRGVPAVVVGGTSVFETDAANQWLWVLQAIEQPHRADRVRIAALTSIVGCTVAELDREGDDLVARIGSEMRELADLVATAGFAAAVERLSASHALSERLLARIGGERELTDIRHLAELVNVAAVRDGMGVTALIGWLTDRIADPQSGGAQRRRRLDSDAAAVQVATVHASKGLEYPVVYVPFGWDASKNSSPETLLYHRGAERVLDVGGNDRPGYRDSKTRSDAENAGEDLRLLYVALTRARHQVVAWWAPVASTDTSPLHRLVFGRERHARDVPLATRVPDDAAIESALRAWAADSPVEIAIERVGEIDEGGDAAAPSVVAAPALAAARFARELDYTWRRTSYSALTASAHDHAPVAAPDDAVPLPDEPEDPLDVDPVASEEPTDRGAESLMNTLPGGTAFGTLVHSVLETVDTRAADLAADVRSRCAREVAATLADVDVDVLAGALVEVLRTPLALDADGADLALADVAPSDRLAELDFELPLDGGDDPGPAPVLVTDIADILRAHLPDDDVLASYADAIADLDPIRLRGHLTGSIDAVLRVGADPARFVVVDYKTNRLAVGDLTTADYTRDAMADEMIRAHYPLQALLYSVALHRFLRWRVPGYDPEVHLGGTRYLFVRGMIGPSTPDGCGVFAWDPPARLVVALSELLAGRR